MLKEALKQRGYKVKDVKGGIDVYVPSGRPMDVAVDEVDAVCSREGYKEKISILREVPTLW